MKPLNTVAALEDGRAAGWNVLSDTGRSYIASVSLEAWLNLPPHPRQRDARKQANKDHWQAAKIAAGAVQERLRWVDAAELDGKIFKLDGHARSLLWENAVLPRPDFVNVVVYRCDNREDLNALYGTFDSPDAAETMYDRVCGAYHEHGLRLESKRLRYGSIVDALHIAVRGSIRTQERGQEINLYGAVGMFRSELTALDSVDPQPEVFVTGLVAAALIALSSESRALEFFKLISAGEGSKDAGRKDPIEAVLVRIRDLQTSKSTRLRDAQLLLCGFVLRTLEAWLGGRDKEAYWSVDWLDHRDQQDRMRAYVMTALDSWISRMRASKGIVSAGDI